MADERREPGPEGSGLALADLAGKLRALGVGKGQTLLVHASLRALGPVDGHAKTVIEALREAVGETGTIVVAAGTDANSSSSRVHRERIAGLTPEQVAEYRNQKMAAFDRQRTATGYGPIAEALRTTPGAVRSAHPQSSFAALGPRAEELMSGHVLTCHLGLRSPLGRLYQLDAGGGLGAHILMLGVDYRACSAFHLAEYLYTKYPPGQVYACVTSVGGRRRWTVYRDVVLDDSDFAEIGACLGRSVVALAGSVGAAPSRLIPLSGAVDHATQWMRDNRS